MHDNVARTISTLGVWAAVAVVLTFGVFGITWGAGFALVALVVVVTAIAWAAASATHSIWGGKPKGNAPATADFANKGP